ncbi:MAG: phytoene/squalene synthase family protein [candidate division NC10 bacterium]|nr:phytoene/squalene synthase family protein [candidate division NC10 bacterium]
MKMVWSEADWHQMEERTRQRAWRTKDAGKAWHLIVLQSRAVMRTYSTSFFVVSRFLPPRKRDMVEVIYANVRYPDEVVDTFHLTSAERLQWLDRWESSFEAALREKDLIAALAQGVPCFLVALAEVFRLTRIPPDHYRAFLDAMRQDVHPRTYTTLDDLINSYVYGSAIVVGYFLTHIYGSSTPEDFQRALESARHLGIALQLTNFLRDVREDQQRGRIYLPQDDLRAEGIEVLSPDDPSQQPALTRVIHELAQVAESFYGRAEQALDAFAEDSRIAIKACMDVYRLLNRRLLQGEAGAKHRESVPLWEKLKPLPTSKLWKIPWAYVRR